MGRFTDTTAIITGAARGIGAATARDLVAEGGNVIVTDVLDDEGRALADELGDAATFLHLDVTDADAWDEAVTAAETRYGPVGVLINNAGVLAQGPIDGGDIEEFRWVVEVNLTGVYLGMRAVIASMRRAGGGSIVNVSSTAGLQGYAYLSAYVASKWGVRGMTKTAALELGPDRIRVNSVHPGPIETPMTDGVDASMAAAQPIPRFGTPAEVSRLIAFLASNDASYSTGAEFVVDGGQVTGAVIDALKEG